MVEAMAWKRAWTLLPMLLASCSDPAGSDDAVPGMIVIGRLERQLVGRPCIGALDRWERHYFYGYGPRRPAVDRNLIHVVYFEAGVDGFRSERRIERLDDLLIYDGLALYASGSFHPDTGAVTVDFCGPSNAPLTPAQANASAK